MLVITWLSRPMRTERDRACPEHGRAQVIAEVARAVLGDAFRDALALGNSQPRVLGRTYDAVPQNALPS